MKLIIIEDDPNFATLVIRALDGLAESVRTVESWDNAKAELDDSNIVWVDLRMPTSSESDSIKRIEDLRRINHGIVIVVGSGFITPELRAKLDRAGVDGCFYKDSQFKAEQVASLVVLAIMRSLKRNSDGVHDGETQKKILQQALAWMTKRYPSAQITEGRTMAQSA